MNIEYQNAVVGSIPSASEWLPGDLEPIPTGSYSVKKPNGKYLMINSNGGFVESDSIVPLSAFVPDSDLNVLRVGYGNNQGPRFVIYYRYV